MKKTIAVCSSALILLLLQGAGEEVPLAFDGFTEAYRVVYLASPVDGVVETVAVQRGDRVSRGQVLANLEATVEKATLDLTEARTKLEGDLRGQQARLQYSRLKYAHDEKLRSDGVLSEDELEQSKTERLLAEAAVLKAEESIRLNILENKRAEAALELRTIRSPIDGVVIDRFVSPGELVTRVNHSKILGVAQINPLRVEVFLAGSYFGKIAAGQEALVTPEVFPDRKVKAQVKTVDPVIDPASGTFRVRLEMLNEDHRLPAGLKCRVRFVKQSHKAQSGPKPDPNG